MTPQRRDTYRPSLDEDTGLSATFTRRKIRSGKTLLRASCWRLDTGHVCDVEAHCKSIDSGSRGDSYGFPIDTSLPGCAESSDKTDRIGCPAFRQLERRLRISPLERWCLTGTAYAIRAHGSRPPV